MTKSMNMFLRLGINFKFIKTIKQSHNFYLKCDILLLADVFQKFRNNNLMNYGLCWSHYLGAPGLSLDAMLNMTKVEFELILDFDIYSRWVWYWYERQSFLYF